MMVVLWGGEDDEDEAVGRVRSGWEGGGGVSLSGQMSYPVVSN